MSNIDERDPATGLTTQEIEAENRAWRVEVEQERARWRHRATMDEYVAIEVALAMSDPSCAMKLMRALDIRLHPWGKPGELPLTTGLVWLWLPGGWLGSATVLADGGDAEVWPELSDEKLTDSEIGDTCFRVRWTPGWPT